MCTCIVWASVRVIKRPIFIVKNEWDRQIYDENCMFLGLLINFEWPDNKCFNEAMGKIKKSTVANLFKSAVILQLTNCYF